MTSASNPTHDPPPEEPGTSHRALRVPLLASLCAIYGGFGLYGYGNDCDTYLMLRSGRNLLLEGTYDYSRPPGYFVPEMILGGISLLGGHWLTNILSALLATASLYLFWRLLETSLPRYQAAFAVAFVGLNPHFIIAASSSIDYVYSLFFILSGVTALRARSPYGAAVLFALAISSRLSNLPIVVILYAHFLHREYRVRGPKAVVGLAPSVAMAACLTIALFIPSFIAAGNTLGFLSYAIGDWTFFGHLTRFIYKNIGLLGLLPLLMLATLAVVKMAVVQTVTGRLNLVWTDTGAIVRSCVREPKKVAYPESDNQIRFTLNDEEIRRGQEYRSPDPSTAVRDRSVDRSPPARCPKAARRGRRSRGGRLPGRVRARA